MATLILLRHGRTTSNASGTLAGRQPAELDEAGRAQAVAVGERLRAAKVPLAAVVSSPLLRCTQTVELALPGTVPVIEPGLVEAGYGDWEGQPLKKLAKQPLWQVVQVHPSAARFPGGELSGLRPPPRRSRRRATKASSDAPVGGGLGTADQSGDPQGEQIGSKA